VRQSNSYTFIFILIVAALSAMILSIASQTLQKRQRINIELDKKKNILVAVDLLKDGKCAATKNDEKCTTAKCCYDENIKSFIIDNKGNVKKTKLSPEQINFEEELLKKGEEQSLPVFARVEKGKIIAYCIPLVGKGLWSTLYGYLALKNDLNTVMGLTFYKHGETPGLGAEIENKWFQQNFIGKKIFDENGKLVGITVVKGKVNLKSKKINHEVDGISGATLTGNGVNKLIQKNLLLYYPYFKMLRKEHK